MTPYFWGPVGNYLYSACLLMGQRSIWRDGIQRIPADKRFLRSQLEETSFTCHYETCEVRPQSRNLSTCAYRDRSAGKTSNINRGKESYLFQAVYTHMDTFTNIPGILKHGIISVSAYRHILYTPGTIAGNCDYL